MKKVFKIILLSLPFVLVYAYLCFLFIPKDITDQGGEGYYRGKGFLAEPVKHSLDVITFGHSSVYSGFSPAVLYEEFGYTSYASGAPIQTIDRINKLLDKAIVVQRPKVILLDVDCLYYPGSFIQSYNTFFAPFIYHARWKTLKPRDFYKIPGKINDKDLTKGYYFSENIVKVDPKNYMGNKDDKPSEISKINLQSLNRFIKKCRDNNIELVFVDYVNINTWNYGKHNYIQEIANKNNIEFLDLNVANEKYAIDFDNDFRDNGHHYNVYGAKKATLYFGKYIQEKYGDKLKDKRQDEKFAYWQKVVDAYKEQFKGNSK